MRPNDFMMYGEEGMFYRDHLKDLAREGVPSSAMPSFKEWQESKLKEFSNREEIKPERSRYGTIKFIVGAGLATYLAFQAYSCLSADRYWDKKEYSAPQDNPNENQTPGNLPLESENGTLPPEITLPLILGDKEETEERMKKGQKELKRIGVIREIEKETEEQEIYREWEEWREGKKEEEKDENEEK